MVSFREKRAWISLVAYFGVYGYYFWTVVHVAIAGQSAGFRFGTLIHPMFLLAIIEAGLNIIAAVWAPKDAQAAEDEREKLILLKATRIAFPVLLVGAATATAGIAFGVSTFYTGNGLLLAIVLAQMTRSAGQIAYFRAGA